MCEYAHGVFECWLHPAQYRTRLCKDGTSCSRRVCFFAHTNEELRPLYVSTGSAVPSPRSSAAAAAVEMAAAMSLLPGSPSSVSVMSPAPFTPPMSPSANGGGHSSLAWPQPNVPALHLPGGNLQSSRLRTSLNARDLPVDDFSVMSELEAAQQQLNDFCFSSGQARLGSPLGGNRPVRSKTVAQSNLDDLFSAEISSSPRYNSDQGAVFSPTHKSAVLNQFQQQQQQSLLSPISNNGVFSPKAVDPQQQLSGHSALLQASLGVSSPGRMPPRNIEPASPMSSRLAAFAQREKLQQQLRSLSSRDLSSNNGVPSMAGSPANSSWSNWGSPSGKVDWGVNGGELGRYNRSASFELGSRGEEPDVSWVQSLVSPPELKDDHEASNTSANNGGSGAAMDGSNSNAQLDGSDHTVLGAWLEQLQLDQLVA